MKPLHFYAIGIFITYSQAAVAQVTKYEIGINAGTFIYQGDLAPAALGSYKTPAFAWGISGTKNLTGTLGLRLDFNSGKLKGNDSLYQPAWRKERAFAFTASVKELVLSVVYTPLNDTRFTPYFFAGAGFSFLNTQRDYSRFNAEYFQLEATTIQGLQTDINHALPGILPILPIGLGLRYGITDRLSVNTEASYRIMSSDYIDGFSQAANPAQKDHYYKYSVGLIFSFGKKNNHQYGCPTIKF